MFPLLLGLSLLAGLEEESKNRLIQVLFSSASISQLRALAL